MRITSLITALLLAVPVVSSAQDAPSYRCVNGDLDRRVVVMYETGVTVPCEVHYFKDTEEPGTSQVLWRALNEEGYCEARAADFVAKLEGWGWSCDAATADAGTSTDAESSDDTDALAPSEDDTASDPR